MELLTEISNAIDFLRSKPEEIDVTETIRLLSLSHEVARDGLKRSQHADLYLQLQPKHEELESRVPELEEKIENQTDLLAKACVQIETFKEVLAAIRQETVGKLELIKAYGHEFKAALKKKIDDGDIAGVLEVRATVLSDFNKEWDRPIGANKLPSEPETIFVDHKLYKTGA